MTYTIELIDIKKKDVEEKLRILFKDAFNMPELPSEGYVYKNTNSNASNPSVYIAAIENGEIIGCNCFIAIDCFIKEKKFTCYQSCWTATHPKHQGRKIFVTIINYAKEYLKAQGAGFIFGLPNDNSYPIFMKKLGFVERPALVSRIPNLPIIKNLFFNDDATATIKQQEDETLMVKEEQVIALKQQENRETIEVVRINESYAWGKIQKVKKFGISITYFYIGGVFLKDPKDYKTIINKIFSQYRISYVQIVSCESNSWNLMIKKWKKAGMNGFIFFDLNMGAVKNINMMFGIIDVF